MGAWVKPIIETAKQAFTGVGTSHAGEAVHDLFGAKDDFFRSGGASGEAIRSLHMDYQAAKARYTSMLDAPLKSLSDSLAKDKIAVSDDTSINKIHNTLVSMQHPAAQHSGQLLARGSNYATANLKQASILNLSEARTMASAQVLGPKYENVIPYIMNAYDTKDPVAISWAKGVMNLLSNETHDTSVISNFQGGNQEVSKLKYSVGKAFKQENKMRTLMGGSGDLPSVDISPTYHNPGEVERRVQNVLRTVQLPFVALKHISTVGNLSSIPAPNLVKGLLGMGDSQFKQFLDTTGILSYTLHDMMDKNIRGRFGNVAHWTGSPSIGQIFHNAYHMPLFDFVRSTQLQLAAAVGYHSATSWAGEALKGSKRAIAELKEMGIDINEVAKQGGVLNDDQKRKALFHFVNNRFFMDKSIERSQLSNSNPWIRSATMYHTFVNAQQRFMRRELGKMFKANDYVGIAQFAATIGILYPAVAPMLKSLEIFGRTLSAQAATQSAKQDYEKLTNGNFGDMSSTYLDLLSHYGAFGVYTSYVAAAHGNRFAYALMGPTIGVGARAGEDLINAVTKTNKLGKHNINPIARDLFEDTIPVVGNIAGHRLFPTTKEQQASKPHRRATRRRF